jgi:hypothetical protein
MVFQRSAAEGSHVPGRGRRVVQVHVNPWSTAYRIACVRELTSSFS